MIKPRVAAEAADGRGEANRVNTRVYGKMDENPWHNIYYFIIRAIKGITKQTEKREHTKVKPVGILKIPHL